MDTKQEEKNEVIRWLWREEIPRVLQSRPDDVMFVYRTHPAQTLPTCCNSTNRMGKLWARERDLFPEEEARQIEAKLASLGTAGQSILAAADMDDDAKIVATMYGISDGQVFFLALDGECYSTTMAAEIVAEARPWMRADLMARWERHAKVNDLARQWLEQLKACVGGCNDAPSP